MSAHSGTAHANADPPFVGPSAQDDLVARPWSDLIAPGDLVRLKAGGPCMVVVGAAAAGGYVTAQWFYEGSLLSSTIMRIALVPADGPDWLPLVAAAHVISASIDRLREDMASRAHREELQAQKGPGE